MSAPDRFATDSAIQEAAGSIEAQKAVDGLLDNTLNPDHAWLGFVQVAARYGWRSPACRAYVMEIAKRAAVHA
ncbi:hypothetical protein [Rhizobacter sp. Root404]|uniref:hypothetical protein n=1 Tax=Rhizobacter sp. Root404 TaxID=1736528 RepID=UPI0006F92F5F|nr:hypothetical protein [Rhizobacter sp. Root404]KQW36510.1 hypothetical protein ASC76_17750 [Rhizobacter sp. Root404]